MIRDERGGGVDDPAPLLIGKCFGKGVIPVEHGKKKVFVALTGGTIASAFKGQSAWPDEATVDQLKNAVRVFFGERGVEATLFEPWGRPGYDSSDLDPGNWVQLTDAIATAFRDGCRGALILHGTDTMAYTAAWLSLNFVGSPLPVILTGSQFTRDFSPEDGSVNLRGAAQVVASGFPGVWIYFNWKLIPGARAHKARAIHPDAYVAENGFPVYFNPAWGRGVGETVERLGLDFSWSPSEECRAVLGKGASAAREAAKRIRWIYCTPGTEPTFTGKEKYLGVIGYGSGNASHAALESIRKAFTGTEKPEILACSQAEGDVKNPKAYHGVGIGMLAEAGFNVWNQMDFPIEFIHALACFAEVVLPEDPGRILGTHLKRIR
jgi:L-asparaginase